MVVEGGGRRGMGTAVIDGEGSISEHTFGTWN